MSSDYEKHNSALEHGWVIMYFMSHDLKPGTIKKTLEQVYKMRQSRLGTKPLTSTQTRHDIPNILKQLREEYGRKK